MFEPTQDLKLHTISKIDNGIEELWVTSECSVVIHLSIDVSTGRVSGFSCRLGPGIVADMGTTTDASTNMTYPMLCIFAEYEKGTSPLQFCRKRGTQWVIES
jgi:hypothetical protein